MLSTSEQVIGQFNIDRIRDILPTIKRQAETKRDFIASASRLHVTNAGGLVFPNLESFRLEKTGQVFTTWAEAEAVAEAGEKIIPAKAGGEFPLSRTAERQLCAKLSVPLDFVDRLRKEGQSGVAAASGRSLERKQRIPSKNLHADVDVQDA